MMMMMDYEGCSNQSSGVAGISGDYFYNATINTSMLLEINMSNMTTIEAFHDGQTLPLYLQITCLILLVVIFTVGTIGNIMVTLVISCSRDMRTSTNIFLVNLSIADLLVLVICIPTALIEVTYHPERWVLGFYMCKFVPLLETTVANTSVLTILAISFERYYAICRPLRANYICTKSRAAIICLAAWVMATIITSPMIYMISYQVGINECGDWSARCQIDVMATFPIAYTISSIILLFLVPFFILLVTYGMIARKLTSDRTALNAKNENQSNHKARKQVVLMLGTVVFTFFLCLLPFRVLTLIVLLVGIDYDETYQNFLYFSRILIYINSALNPILYNIMSSKFRNGFLRLCNRSRKYRFKRTGTFITNTTTTTSTNVSINLGHQPGANGYLYGKGNGHCSGHNPLGHSSSLYNKRNGSPSSARPDLLKTLIRTQSVVSGPIPSSAAANNSPAQSVYYYNNHHHACGNTGRHHPYSGANGLAITNGCVGGRKTQNHLILNGHHHNGTNGISTRTSNHMTSYSNGDACMMNGKHMTVKSDSVYTAYLPGTRSETVL